MSGTLINGQKSNNNPFSLDLFYCIFRKNFVLLNEVLNYANRNILFTSIQYL